MRRSIAGGWIALALVGCEPAPPVVVPDSGGVDIGEPVPDGRVDVIPDAEPDAMADAMADEAGVMDAADPVDAAPDAIVDAMPDAVVDAMVDAMPDADPDGPPDAMPDATPDGMIDATPDATRDAEPLDAEADDSIPFWDATPDQAVDAAVDQAVDAEIDAEPDMAPFDGPARSDDFEVGPLGRAWQIVNGHLFEREVRDGALWLTPVGRGLWFGRSTGPMIHQPATGDFRVTARVRARRASDPASPPAELVHLGGLIARDPRTPPENYVFIVVGRDVDDLSVETKTTELGRSAFTGPMWPGGSDAELRICRLGADFHMYKRPIEGGEWQLAETFARPDLPETVQVGAIAYTNSAAPDLTVGFEEIDFADVADEADCTADPPAE